MNRVMTKICSPGAETTEATNWKNHLNGNFDNSLEAEELPGATVLVRTQGSVDFTSRDLSKKDLFIARRKGGETHLHMENSLHNKALFSKKNTVPYPI